MTETQIWIISGLGLYFIAMIAIGIISGRSQSHDGFVIGSRNVGYIPTIGSLSAGFRDGAGALFWFGFGALMGYAGLWLIFGAMISLFFFTAFGPKIRAYAEEQGFITIGEIIRKRLGKITERTTAVIIVIFALMAISIQLFVAGNLFATVLGLSATTGVFSVAAIVGIYLFFGGYSTVVKTDAIQFFLIIAMIITPFFIQPSSSDLLDVSTLFSMSVSDQIGLFLVGIFFVLGMADVWQRVFSARDAQVIRKGFPIAGVFVLIMTLAMIWLGMGAKPYLGDNINTNDALFSFFLIEEISAPLLAFIAIALMAITMSTLDTQAYLTASTITKNLLPKDISKNRNTYIKISRALFILILATMSILAITITDVIQFIFDAASLLFILVPIYLGAALGLYKENIKTDIAVSFVTAISCIIYIYMFINGTFESLIYTSVPVFINIFFCGIIILYQRLRKA